eukprot:m.68890 g.68890  ORF g.68890 m.68890 type:complete len:140 (+) comp35569_c0_seq9:349-768(+)
MRTAHSMLKTRKTGLMKDQPLYLKKWSGVEKIHEDISSEESDSDGCVDDIALDLDCVCLTSDASPDKDECEKEPLPSVRAISSVKFKCLGTTKQRIHQEALKEMLRLMIIWFDFRRSQKIRWIGTLNVFKCFWMMTGNE